MNVVYDPLNKQIDSTKNSLDKKGSHHIPAAHKTTKLLKK